MKYKLLHQLEMNTTVLAVTLFQKNFRKQNIRPFVIGYHSLMVETDRSIRIHLSVAHRHFNLKTSLQPFQIKKRESATIPDCVKTTSGRGHTAVSARWMGVVDDTSFQLNADNLQATTATTQRSG